MTSSLPSHFIDLVKDVVLKSFWRKTALRTFLSRHKIKETVLATWAAEESKREFLEKLFPRLESIDAGQAVIKQMAASLSEQVAFPDLMGWEDEALKLKSAKEAVAALKVYLKRSKEDEQSQKEKESIRQVNRDRREDTWHRSQTLEKLNARLVQLLPEQGTQSGGYRFQEWFYDLVEFFEMQCRRPYVTSGRQIDGTVTVEGTTYLIELKFTSGQSDATDIDSLLAKLTNVADNTMGLMISMAGFSSVAVTQASGKRTPLILADYGHVMALLQGTWKLEELIARLRRHVSQTGEALLPMQQLLR
ncbi:MAG: restriction endonuclease [Stenotrophobium sp.]